MAAVQSADSLALDAAMDDDEADLDYGAIDAIVAAHQAKAKKVQLRASLQHVDVHASEPPPAQSHHDPLPCIRAA